jgi:PII-like signaling protein
METEVTVVRIYLSEADHGRRKTLMQEVLNILHDQHKVRGVTVFRGIAGIGDTGEVHASDMLRILVDLPLVIEFFDTPEVVTAVLSLLTPLIPAGHTISWSATCR